jgi:hypothetical protein
MPKADSLEGEGVKPLFIVLGILLLIGGVLVFLIPVSSEVKNFVGGVVSGCGATIIVTEPLVARMRRDNARMNRDLKTEVVNSERKIDETKDMVKQLGDEIDSLLKTGRGPEGIPSRSAKEEQDALFKSELEKMKEKIRQYLS